MDALSEEGLIYRTAGKGTFVRQNTSKAEEPSFVFVILSHKAPDILMIVEGIEKELRKNNMLYSLHFLDTKFPGPYDNRLDALLMELLNYNPKGFIVGPHSTVSGETAFAEIHRRGIPLVLLDKDYDTLSIDCVSSDNYSGMRKLTQYVVDCGHRKIAYLSFKDIYGDTLVKRHKAFTDCLNANKIPVNNSIIDIEINDLEGVAESVKRIFVKEPQTTAMICANDSIAQRCYSVFESIGKKIPDDISICSFDGYSATRHLTPSLTAMSQDLYEIGKNAVRIIRERQSNSDFLTRNVQIKYYVPTTFLECDSVKKINCKKEI